MPNAIIQRTDFFDAWKTFLDTGETRGVPTHISDSWIRCKKFGVDPLNEITLNTVDQSFISRRTEKNKELHQIMRPVHFVPETASLNNVFIEFFERHQHLFMVVDEYGSITGIISMEDIIEEIVGREIVDESDKIKDMRELARTRKKGSQQKQPQKPKGTS